MLRMVSVIGFEVHVLTQGPSDKDLYKCWGEKNLWYHEHVLPVVSGAKMTIGMDKGLVYGAVLVDDFPGYMSRWLEHRPRGLGVMVENKFNNSFEHDQVVRYNGENRAEVYGRLKEAFERQGLNFNG